MPDEPKVLWCMHHGYFDPNAGHDTCQHPVYTVQCPGDHDGNGAHEIKWRGSYVCYCADHNQKFDAADNTVSPCGETLVV
jgi:hypothetical protein